MSWARVDDRYHSHPKVRQAWRRHSRAVGLHILAISYSAAHETDGLLDAWWLEDQIPGEQERVEVLTVLVEAGLFDRDDEGRVWVHDFLDFNRSREEADVHRAQAAERQRRSRERRRVTDPSQRDARVTGPSVTPLPTRPDPTHPDQEVVVVERAPERESGTGLDALFGTNNGNGPAEDNHEEVVDADVVDDPTYPIAEAADPEARRERSIREWALWRWDIDGDLLDRACQAIRDHTPASSDNALHGLVEEELPELCDLRRGARVPQEATR